MHAQHKPDSILQMHLLKSSNYLDFRINIEMWYCRHELMLQCWNFNAKDRPLFPDILSSLNKHAGVITLDFDRKNQTK